jgi:hypothetical protein
MRKMTGATQEENDKLALSVEKMKAHLAEIEKKPATNGAALALAEARLQVDELATSLGADLEQITKLFKENGLGDISAFLTSQTGTDGVKKMVQDHIDAINAVDYKEQDKLSTLKTDDVAGRKKVTDDAQVERLKAIKTAADDVTASYNRLHDASIADQKLQDKEGLGSIQGHDPHQSDAAMAILGTTGHQFQSMYSQVALGGQASAITAQTEAAEAREKGVSEAKEADEKFLKDRQDRLKEIEATNALSLQQEKMYWDAMARIPGLSAGSRALMNRQGTDVQAQITKQNSTDANNDGFAFVRDQFDIQGLFVQGGDFAADEQDPSQPGFGKGFGIGPGGAHYNFSGLGGLDIRFGDQPPSDVLTSLQANDSNWPSTAHGTGIAYCYLTIGFNTSMFPQLPEIRFTINGKNTIFDPRNGLTGYSTNWALQVAGVITDPEFGLGDNTVNQAQLIAAANICDEEIPISQGGESRYTQNLHYDTGSAPGDVLAMMMPSAGGKVSRIGGEWFIWPAAFLGASIAPDESFLVDSVTWTPTRKYRGVCVGNLDAVVEIAGSKQVHLADHRLRQRRIPAYPADQAGFPARLPHAVQSGPWLPDRRSSQSRGSKRQEARDISGPCGSEGLWGVQP